MASAAERLPRPNLWAVVGGLVLVLCLTAWIALGWSAHKLLNQDEMFVLQTDGVRSLAEVVRIQLHYPISLDPIVYHALAHVCTRLFGVTAFALRLPSLAGFLLMQLCLFVFVARAAQPGKLLPMRLSSAYAGYFAMLFPVLTATLYYAAEARPYGLLLGLYALALVGYQGATRNESERVRTVSLWTLGAAIALTLNAHYFGILLLPAVYAAEAVRTFARRRVDFAVAATIVASTMTAAFAIPFQHAAKVFRIHYYNAGKVGLRAITQAYRSLLVDYTDAPERMQHDLAILFVFVAAVFLLALALRWRSLALPAGEATFVTVLCALPFFGFVIARFVTHTYEVRYVLGAIIGITVLLALLVAPLLQRPRVAHWIIVLTAVAVIQVGKSHVRAEIAKTNAVMQSLAVPANVRAALAADPTHNLYMQQMGHYEVAQYYQPDPLVRAHTVLVYSPAREIFFDHHDTEALTAEHMTHFTSLPIARYEDVVKDPHAHVWALYNSGWDFTPGALSEDQAVQTPIAPWFEGTATVVQFPHP